MKELELEAEKIVCSTYNVDSSVAYSLQKEWLVKGATCKYVEVEKLKFAKEQLILVGETLPTSSYYTTVCYGQIEKINQQLKELGFDESGKLKLV